MAISQLTRDHQIGRLTNHVIEKGTRMVNFSTTFFSRLSVSQRIAAAATVLASLWLFSITSLWSGKKEVYSTGQDSMQSKQGTVSKLRKLKVVRFSTWIAQGFLKLLENIISPRGGRVLSQNELPITNSDQARRSPTTPPSVKSSGISNEDSRPPSCASLMEDLSESTLTTPIRDLRHQMASKVRSWRFALHDECDGRRGYYELQHTSATAPQERKSSWLSRAWNFFRRTGKDSETDSGAIQELRKRKRPEGEDYLALYVPLNKGVHRLDETDSRHAFSEYQGEVPSIRGLSIVPVIGNWYSAEKSENINGKTEEHISENLDHISLIQRDFLAPSKQASDCASDGEQYEILDMETRNATPTSIDPEK